ncbi:hypothetical protein [Paracidovorax anthurii]|uniref:Uncharacterized protein n=1 Tax=Paracidovorax anthurii TaxID=78229 RepID=A0A328ZJH9_9BURK|nr:hypothetical protein [Paracidovorax anthurii]RAR86049.1 hypothetical protein AX018_100210 [Paracidovorax anthurii]
MDSTQLTAPTGLPIVGALTEDGSVCKLSSYSRQGAYSDYVYELPDSPMIQPTILVDTEGNQWSLDGIGRMTPIQKPGC